MSLKTVLSFFRSLAALLSVIISPSSACHFPSHANNFLNPLGTFLLLNCLRHIRGCFGLWTEDGGLLLNYVIPDGGPYKFGLRVNDILLEIDGHKIDNFGEIFFEPLDQRIHFEKMPVQNQKINVA